MPFEPLRTDEPLEAPAPKAKDWDTQMLIGCGAFVATSLITYLLALWPFFVIPRTYELGNLLFTCALSMIPTGFFGAYVSRKFGLPAASGFIGGTMATCIFLFLRLQQIMLGRHMREMPIPEYPDSWTWALPTAWLAIAVLLTLFFLPKREYTDEVQGPTNR